MPFSSGDSVVDETAKDLTSPSDDDVVVGNVAPTVEFEIGDEVGDSTADEVGNVVGEFASFLHRFHFL